MKAALRVSLKDSNWVNKLPWVMLGLRAVPKEDLQSSSTELVYGQPLQIPRNFISNSRAPWSATKMKTTLMYNARVSALVPTTQQGLPQSHVPTSLQSADYVFTCHDAHRDPSNLLRMAHFALFPLMTMPGGGKSVSGVGASYQSV